MAAPNSVREFLSGKRIAVVGVSRSSAEAANVIYRKLRQLGYEVFAVNPNATELEGDPAYPDVSSLPDDVDGAMVLVPAEAAEGVVRECAATGISRVWLHRSFGSGSVSEAAVSRGKELGVTVIPGGCPMMYAEPIDFGHRCMRWILGFQRRLPTG